MVYLLNSGYQGLYVANVFRTMFLPSGASNEYRYRRTGEYRSIDEGFARQLSETPAGAQAVVVFVDRYASGGYRYLPLRRGRLLRSEPAGERQYVRIALGEFIFPRDLAEFNQAAKEQLGPKGLPKLTGNDPNNKDDGYYALEGPDLFQRESGWLVADAAWDAAVNGLYGSKVLSPAGGKMPAFSRCRLLLPNKKEKAIEASICHGEWFLQLIYGWNYVVELYYKAGSEAQKRSAMTISMSPTDNLEVTGPTSVRVDADSNRVHIPLAAGKAASGTVGVLKFSLGERSAQDQEGAGGVEPVGIEVPCRIGMARRHWVYAALLVLLFILCSAMKEWDFAEQAKTLVSAPDSWRKCLISWLGSYPLLVRIVSEILQVISILLGIRIVGHRLT